MPAPGRCDKVLAMSRPFAAALALLAACCCPALAQQPLSDAAKAMVGTWEFTNAERDKTCTITLRTDPVTSGMRADFDKDCAAKFPFIADVSGWTYNEGDFLRLVDTSGGAVLEFSEVESGVYEAPRPGEGILFIQNAGAAGPPQRTAADVTGEWTVVRAGKSICSLTLSNTAMGEGFAVRVRQPCDPFVVRFAPAAWQVERGELVLKPAKGQSWRFEEQDGNSWQRLPASAGSVLLVRK
jgi:hypothetical protein